MLEGHEYDKRWTVRDKLSQYRGVLALYDRDRDNKEKECQKEHSKGHEKICNLKRDIHLLRSNFNEQAKGDHYRLRAILQEDRRIFLALKNKHPLEVIANLQQINFIKLKEINKLRYIKKLRMDHLEKTMVEIEEIKKRAEFGYSAQSPIQKQQMLVNKIEKIEVCNNIAQCTCYEYKRAAALIKEDASYLDHMVSVMSQDSYQQSQCMSDVRIKGEQAATENEKIRSQFHTLEEKTVKRMRMRDRSIRHLRQKVNIQSMRLKSLGGEVSANQVFRFELLIGDEASETDMYTPYMLQELEETIEHLQDVTIVTDYSQVFPRLREQIEQRDRLQRQLELNEKQWESLKIKRDHAKESLSLIKHCQSDADDRRVVEEGEIRKQLDEAKIRKEESCLKMKELSKKMLMIRAAIFTLLELVERIRILDDTPSQESIREETNFEEIICKNENPIETLELIKDRIKRMKLEIGAAVATWPSREDLTGRIILELDSEKQVAEVEALKEKDPMVIDDAKQEYHTKVSEHCSKAHFGDTDDYEYRLEDDLDIDTGIITRTDIKLTSKRIVNNFEMPIVHVSSKKGLVALSTPKKSPRRVRWLKCH